MSKRKYFLMFLVVILLAAACTSEEAPADVLPQETMIPVLADLEIAYAGIDQTVKDPRERSKKYQDMNSVVLKKHNLQHDQFYASYQWYEDNPTLLDTLFKQVVGVLNETLAKLQAEDAAAPPRPAVPELK